MNEMTDEQLAALFEQAMEDDSRWTVHHGPELQAIFRASDAADTATADLAAAVQTARDAGHSWSTIGLALGVSRQAAWERFGTPKQEPRAATRKRRKRQPAQA